MCSKIPGQRWSGIFSSTGKLSEQGRRTEDEKDFKASVRKDHIGRTGGIVSGDMGDSARGGSEKQFPTDGTFDRICSVRSLFCGSVSKDINPAYKLAWTILILAVPIAGGVIYLLFGKSRLGKELQNRLDGAMHEASQYLVQDDAVSEKLAKESRTVACQTDYLYNTAGFPVYQNTKTQYFRVGQELYSRLLHELKKAEHYIFMEYFIIDEGEMWQGILDILEEKARLGLDVRLIYDDWGCASTMPKEFQMSLQSRGIRCEVFNPLLPIASVLLNNRDHRKITVIDGYIGFTGGVNLADEYINRIERFGYWKDTGVMLQGEAVWSLTVMFLQMWSVLANESPDYGKYRPHEWHEQPLKATVLYSLTGIRRLIMRQSASLFI